MSMNELDLDKRLELGKLAEKKVLAELYDKHMPIKLDTNNFLTINSSTREEDMHGGVDAWISTGTETYSVQIKNRETGSDLGLSIIMPYEGDYWFCSNFKAFSELNWDRDMRNVPDYYLVANPDQFCLVRSATVKNGIMAILSSLYNYGGFGGARAFSNPALDGLELRLVRDRGAGYSAGQTKVICYIRLDALKSRGAWIGDRE